MALVALLFLPGVRRGEGQQVLAPLANQRKSDDENIYRVYLPTDRSLSRTMTRAQERLAQQEYHQALEFLHEILSREEDAFLAEPGNQMPQLGLKGTARRLIGTLPASGRDAYELLYGPAARRQLEAAVQQNDQDAVAAVVRQYFHTDAGYEAALILAQMQADQGHHDAAAQLFDELITAPRAAERFEPQLSALAALNCQAANRPERAATILRSLIEANPSARLELFEKKLTLPGPNTDLARWLAESIGQSVPTARSQDDWLTVRGDAARNAQPAGGRPHLRPRWEARVVNEPGVEEFLGARGQEFAQRGIVAFPAARPIALENIVLMRTPSNVVAIDWQTGKRVWETRDDELESNDPSSDYFSIEDEQFSRRGSELEQKVWDDALIMSLASDGERVYVVRGNSATERLETMPWQVMPGLGRNGESNTATSQLAAYDVRTEGKLVWELDGARMEGALDGAIFLGPPLAVDETLYVMAEIRSAIYLLALDPRTGEIIWQQQLVGLEVGIGLDPARRLVGATPSYTEGILVCPTAASTAIAIDIGKREFAWVYRYRRELQSTAETRSIWQQQAQTHSPRGNDRWLDPAAIIVNGKVFLTPPESGDLHCLELHTGKELWKQRRGDALFIGCIDDEKVLLIGPEAVRAIRIADNSPAWPRTSVPLPAGALPAGFGYASEGKYYLPLTSGEIAAIDLDTGDLDMLEAGPQGQTLGNLICHRGSVISQSVLTLSKFEQIEALQRRAQQALADNPADASALRDLAELQQAEGKQSEAIASLKQAYEKSPDDLLTREMLADLVLESLATDFEKHRDDASLLARLINDRERKIRLLRIEAEGLHRLGEHRDAWNAYLRLADYTAGDSPQLRIDAQSTVRSDRWISGRLADLWSESSAESRQQFAAELSTRRGNLRGDISAADLRHYLAHFEALPDSEVVRHQLASLLIDRGRPAEAELELLQSAGSKKKNEQAAAAALMTKLLSSINRMEEAAPFVELLTNNYKEVPALDGHRGGEWVEHFFAGEAKVPFTQPNGQRGRLVAEILPGRRAGRLGFRGQERATAYRPLRVEQDFWPAASSLDWFISLDCTEIVGRTSLGGEAFRLKIDQNNWARQYRDGSLVYAARLGRLMFVALGGQIVAIDSRSGGGDRPGDYLWQAYPMGRYSLESARGRNPAWQYQSRTSRPPVYHAWSDRKRMPGLVGTVIGSLGPVTPRGVVFHEQNQLKCVDPLTGETLWARTDIPAGCELFGDQELVLAADVGEREAFVVRMSDGQLLGTRPLPRAEWLLTAGRNIAQLGFRTDQAGRAMTLTVTDIWSRETLFEAEYPITSRPAVVEPFAVAMCEPSGKFQLIDVRNGQSVVNAQLDAVSDLQNVQTISDGDALFVVLNTRPTRQPQNKPVGQFEYPIVNGPMYAFDLNSGEQRWPGPAILRNRGLVLQPSGLPLLVLADRAMDNQAASGGRWGMRLLCLDKQTGETMYRNDRLPDSAVTLFHIAAAQNDPHQMTLQTNAGTIQLAMTAEPRPPRPPANDDVEREREGGERGLVGLGERMGAVLRGTLERPPNNAGTPGSPPGRPDGRPDEGLNQLDDD